MEEGAAGYLHKLSANGDGVLAAVRAVATGSRFFPAAVAGDHLLEPAPARSGGPLSRLTAREREVLTFVAGGADNLKIASFLQITERTVKAHVSSLYRKLGSENRTQLALLARQLGIRPPPGL
jgi:DNA-binding NarL/FixJ family response regulator